MALHLCLLPGGKDVSVLPVEMRQCRGEVADRIEYVGELLHHVGHTKRSTTASNVRALVRACHNTTCEHITIPQCTIFST